jgi:hypothetical protein
MEKKKEYRDTEQNSLRGELIKRSILKYRVFFQDLYHSIIIVIIGDKIGFKIVFGI